MGDKAHFLKTIQPYFDAVECGDAPQPLKPPWCPICGEDFRMVWIGFDPLEPYGDVCGCPDALAALDEARGEKAVDDSAGRAVLEQKP